MIPPSFKTSSESQTSVAGVEAWKQKREGQDHRNSSELQRKVVFTATRSKCHHQEQQGLTTKWSSKCLPWQSSPRYIKASEFSHSRYGPRFHGAPLTHPPHPLPVPHPLPHPSPLHLFGIVSLQGPLPFLLITGQHFLSFYLECFLQPRKKRALVSV